MTEFDWKALTIPELLRCFANILDELKERKVVRTRNNPVADYAEWLVAQQLGLSLERNSKRGYDAIDQSGTCYQIKSRRLDPTNKSKQLSVIRRLDAGEFDYLVAVLFNRDFTVKEAYKVPHGVIKEHARFSELQNGHILQLQGEVLTAPGVENITEVLGKHNSTTDDIG
ncbi:hypothetical protein ES703_20828 [subsurface metagenome]